jgi:hypothetical protein
MLLAGNDAPALRASLPRHFLQPNVGTHAPLRMTLFVIQISRLRTPDKHACVNLAKDERGVQGVVDFL